MSLDKFLTGALIVFLVGLGILYSGVNRTPFRQHEHDGPQHQKTHSALPLHSDDSLPV